MTKTQGILVAVAVAVALAAGASALAAPGASAAVGSGPAMNTHDPTSLSQLDKLNELGQVTGALAPVTQVLGSVQ